MRSVLVLQVLLFAAITVIAGCNNSRREEAGNAGTAAQTGGQAAGAAGEKLAAGQDFAAFELPDLKGKRTSLKDFSGKVVLVNFWATWCIPCISEMPSLERLYQTHKKNGLEIVAITVDSPTNRPKVEKFVKDTGLSFPILLDPEMTLPPGIGITGFPESFFVGPDGKLIAFVDPELKRSVVRVISDRPWDSPVFIEAIGKLLEQHLKK